MRVLLLLLCLWSVPARADPAALPGWADEWVSQLWPTLLANCRALAAHAADRPLGGDPATAGSRAGDWHGFCADAAALEIAQRPPPRRRPPSPRIAKREALTREAALRAFLETRLTAAPPVAGIVTGYYEPILRGAEYPSGPYQVPLLGMPGRTPLPDRAAIEAGALDGDAPALAWVDDAADAFFLHIQGSGRVALHDGRLLRLGYAGQNGHPYRGIGRPLVERGAIARDRMSMQAIRAWLDTAPPGEAAALLRSNPSYVFFRTLEGLRPDQGAPGAFGVPLTPLRSIAVDPAHVPLGMPVWIVTRDPVDLMPMRRLAFAQDVGGAIKGPGRADLYWGWGEAAGARAGRMREAIELRPLLPRPAEPADATVQARLAHAP